MRLILQDEFLVVYIPLVGIVKFQYLARFPVDFFPHPVVSSLIIFLRLFAQFTYVIDRFVSITT